MAKTALTAQNPGLIARWLRKVLLDSDEPMTGLELHHLTDGGPRIVRPFRRVVEEGIKDVDQLASEIDEAAYEDAQGLSAGRRQKYAILIFTGDKSEEPTFRWPFGVYVQPNGSLDGVYDDTEEPSERGLIKQIMRHKEAESRTFMIAMGGILGRYENMLAAADKRIATQDAREIESVELYRKLRLEEDSRSRRDRGEARKDKILDEVFDEVKNLGAVFKAHMLPAGPGAQTPKGAVEMQWLFVWFGAHPEAMGAVLTVARQSQQANFAKLFELFKAGTLVGTNQPAIVEGLIKAIVDTLDEAQTEAILEALDGEAKKVFWGLCERFDPEVKAARKAAVENGDTEKEGAA